MSWRSAESWRKVAAKGSSVNCLFTHRATPAAATTFSTAASRKTSGHDTFSFASQATIAEMTPSGLNTRMAFDCALPPLPAFKPEPGFVF